MMKKIAFIIVIMLALFNTNLSLNAEENKFDNRKLRIGHLVGLTEWFSVFDILQDRETRMLAQMINESGGVEVQGQRYMIELISEDFKSSLAGTAAAANKLVYDKNVKFVVGPLGFFALASSPIFEANGILHVSTWSSCQPGEMDKTTPYGFLGFNSVVGEFMGSLDAIKIVYPNVRKIAFTLPDDGAIPYLMPIVEKLTKEAGFTIVGDVVGYPNTMSDFSPISTKLNSFKDADAYFNLNGTPPHIASIVKGLRELGNMKPYIRDGNINCRDILAIAGESAATNVLTGGITPNIDTNPPLVNELYKRLKKQYGDNTLNLENANGLYVLIEVIKKAQSLDPDVVKKSWEKMDTIETLFGTGHMGGLKTYGIRHAVSHPHSIQYLKDGKIISGGWIEVSPIP